MSPSSNPGCSYVLMEHGIHRFIVHNNTRAAVDALFDLMLPLLEDPPEGPDALQLFIYDTVEALPPLQHVVSRTTKLRRSGINIPPSCVVVLYSDNPLMNLTKPLINTLASLSPTRFFRIEEEEEAIAWLLRQRERHTAERA